MTVETKASTNAVIPFNIRHPLSGVPISNIGFRGAENHVQAYEEKKLCAHLGQETEQIAMLAWSGSFVKPFSRQKARQDLVWTPKLAAVFVLSILLQILTAYLILLPLARSDIYLGLFPLVFAFLFLLFLFVNFVFLSGAKF